jgi:ArsR family transcriptional regulator
MHVIDIKPETIFQALSDKTRLRIIRLLTVTDEEVCLCELVDTLLEPQYKLSRHLKILKQSGLLTISRDGRWIYHRLVKSPEYLQQLYMTINMLSDSEGIFQDDLKRFEQRMLLRESGRCRVGIQTGDKNKQHND